MKTKSVLIISASIAAGLLAFVLLLAAISSGGKNKASKKVTGDKFNGDGSFRFDRSSNGHLSMLWLVHDEATFNEDGTESSTLIKPIARSYDGNRWEATIGRGISSMLQFDCDKSSCTVDYLPESEEGSSYQLISWQHSLPKQDEVARFLERTTFGPTKREISDFLDQMPSSSARAMAIWIHEQIDLPMTSHREKYRRHLNHRLEIPQAQGLPTHPCSAGTRYRRVAFSDKDLDSVVEIRTDATNPSRRILLVEGHARTVIDDALELYGVSGANADQFIVFEDGFYEFCFLAIDPYSGVPYLVLRHPSVRRCAALVTETKWDGIPMVHFDDQNPPRNPVLSLDGHARVVDQQYYVDRPELSLVLESDLDDDACESFYPDTTGVPDPFVVATGLFQGEYWIHDPRWSLLNNTVTKPIPDGGAGLVMETQSMRYRRRTQCSNVAKNFVNEHGCYWSDNACVANADKPVPVRLNRWNFQRLYDITSRFGEDDILYVYAVTGLRQEDVPYDSPCTPSTRSRWMPMDSANCTQNAGSLTNTVFARLISSNDDDRNRFVQDVFFPAQGVKCDDSDSRRFDLQVVLEDGKCWKNVHQDELQVFMFSKWRQNHPGGPAAIEQFATDGSFMLKFPDWHEMSRWHVDGQPYRESLGRMGDTIRIPLPADLASALNANKDPPDLVGGMVCGSPNEVANDPFLAGSAGHGAFDAFTAFNRTTPREILEPQKLSVWMDIALNARDQLRQRVAWILAQILVVSPLDGSYDLTEVFVYYYDIFVRHAFGNYRDVLKEVAYSPVMGRMLSYLDSRSTNWVWISESRIEYADENFAREIMQLFSIGLIELHSNGTEVLDGSTGHQIHTYSNDDITEYARLWTGFKTQALRGNIEEASRTNAIDPMAIALEARDSLPKMGLNRQYIGDGLPLCEDLPDQHFLKQGATYRLLGASSGPNLINEPESWARENKGNRLRLDGTSALLEAICGQLAQGDQCRWEAVVVLDKDLQCSGVECEIEAPRVVQVADDVFYEYTRVPCSQLSFYDGQAILPYGGALSCENPSILGSGGANCCSQTSMEGDGESFEYFIGERLSYEGARQRCRENGMDICLGSPTDCSLQTGTCDDSVGYWTNYPCQMQVKVNLEGKVGIVHYFPYDVVKKDWVHWNVREDTKTFFRVDWDGPIDKLVADYEKACDFLGCSRDFSDNLCLCPAEITERQVFSKKPSRDEVLAELKIGAYRPPSNMKKRKQGDGVWMYSDNGKYSSKSIFEVIDDNGIKQYRKNVMSKVIVGTNSGVSLSFRNPPHMISFTNPELRDAHYETDAGLDQYFYHRNTAPFLAIRFTQRLGISNPSPRYVKSIATAFRSGTYVDNESGIRFGSGSYGDLSALVAAALLDNEARSVVLDADPTYGSVLEPFLKFLRVMRSLDFKPKDSHPFVEFGTSLQGEIGQEPYQMPSVFSFFLPLFQPSGAIGEADLYSPESRVLTGPKAISLVNGIVSLIKYGLDAAYGGFGLTWDDKAGEARNIGDNTFGTGRNEYQPTSPSESSDVIDELATLLTSGRLEKRKREVLKDVYEEAISRGAKSEAYINVQQLIATTPEFHANGLSSNLGGSTRGDNKVPDREASDTPYKAVIYLMLEGGFDSFNMLVPHQCEGKNAAGKTPKEQYYSERGELAFLEDEKVLQITSSGNQPCDVFLLHDELPLLKELYESGDLTFFANTGVVAKVDGIDKTNFRSLTPVQLFAHDAMQVETKTVDPMSTAAGTGVLGRLTKVLNDKGYNANTISIDDVSIAVASSGVGQEDGPEPLIISRFGPEPFNPRSEDDAFDLRNFVMDLNSKHDDDREFSSYFAAAWSKHFTTGIHQASYLEDALNSAVLGDFWPISDSGEDDGERDRMSEIAQQFAMVSKLIQTRDLRGSDRDFFYTSFGSWDHHYNLKANLRPMFARLNNALGLLVQELKRQGAWNDVTVVVTSDFGRTITPNSGGGRCVQA